jgi:polyisoprenoid-binding protein YceI
MKKYVVVFILAVCAVSDSITAQNYNPVDETGAVKFIIANLGFDVDGSLKGLKGTIFFDEKNLSECNFDISVDASTINTSNGTRDKHLRGKDYFDVSAFPQIRVTSSKIAKSVTPGYYVMFARLSIKGVTKEISFPFKAVSENGGIRFTGSFKIKRRDFGVGGRNTISNDVDIKLNVFAKKL